MGSGFLSGIKSGIKQNQDEAVEAGAAISAKRKMAQEAGVISGSPIQSPQTTGVRSGGAVVDRTNPAAKFGAKPGEKRIDTKDMLKPLGSYKKGGKIKKTGVYKLHAKERVLNAKQTKSVEGLAKGLMVKDTDKDKM